MEKPTPITKRCPRCDTIRPVAEWSKHKNRADGLSIWCKTCMAEYHREWRARPEVKERQAALAAQRYASMTPEERDAYIQHGIEHRRKTSYHIKMRYGVTGEWYDETLAAQGGGCAICGKAPDARRRHAVDHDHSCCSGEVTCGKCVRGLLCTKCNLQLGYFEDEEWMTSAAKYLTKFGKTNSGWSAA